MAHTEEMPILGVMTPVSVFDSSAQEIDDAAQKALYKDGSNAMTGPLNIESTSGRTARTAYSSTGYATLINRLDSANYNGVRIFPETEALARALVFAHSIVSVISKEYAIFGEHNKPSGSYTGNGSAGVRQIKTGGIGNMLLIWSTTGKAFVTPGGGLHAIGTTITNFAANVARFENGELFIATTDQTMNTNGQTYHYQVL